MEIHSPITKVIFKQYPTLEDRYLFYEQNFDKDNTEESITIFIQIVMNSILMFKEILSHPTIIDIFTKYIKDHKKTNLILQSLLCNFLIMLYENKLQIVYFGEQYISYDDISLIITNKKLLKLLILDGRVGKTNLSTYDGYKITEYAEMCADLDIFNKIFTDRDWESRYVAMTNQILKDDEILSNLSYEALSTVIVTHINTINRSTGSHYKLIGGLYNITEDTLMTHIIKFLKCKNLTYAMFNAVQGQYYMLNNDNGVQHILKWKNFINNFNQISLNSLTFLIYKFVNDNEWKNSIFENVIGEGYINFHSNIFEMLNDENTNKQDLIGLINFHIGINSAMVWYLNKKDSMLTEEQRSYHISTIRNLYKKISAINEFDSIKKHFNPVLMAITGLTELIDFSQYPINSVLSDCADCRDDTLQTLFSSLNSNEKNTEFKNKFSSHIKNEHDKINKTLLIKLMEHASFLTRDIFSTFMDNFCALNSNAITISISDDATSEQMIDIVKKRYVGDPKLQCKVCLLSEITEVFDCGHTLCLECCDQTPICPFCRAEKKTRKIFFS